MGPYFPHVKTCPWLDLLMIALEDTPGAWTPVLWCPARRPGRSPHKDSARVLGGQDPLSFDRTAAWILGNVGGYRWRDMGNNRYRADLRTSNTCNTHPWKREFESAMDEEFKNFHYVFLAGFSSVLLPSPTPRFSPPPPPSPPPTHPLLTVK